MVLGPAQGRLPAVEQGRSPASLITELTITHSFGARAESVFDLLTDARGYPGYTPIRRVEIETEGEGNPNGPGAIRALYLAGAPLREHVITYERPGLFAFEVLSGGPFRSYLGTQTFEPEGDGTLVTYKIQFEPVVPGTGFAVAAGLRVAVETLMRLADREAGSTT